MNTGITHCLVPKAATVKWQQLHRNSSHYRMVLGSSISQLSRNQMAPSEMNPPNSKPIIRNIATDVKLTLLPMFQIVLHFRAVDVASPPFRSESVSFPRNRTSVSRISPPQTRPEKLEAKTATNRVAGAMNLWMCQISFPTCHEKKTPFFFSSHSIPLPIGSNQKWPHPFHICHVNVPIIWINRAPWMSQMQVAWNPNI